MKKQLSNFSLILLGVSIIALFVIIGFYDKKAEHSGIYGLCLLIVFIISQVCSSPDLQEEAKISKAEEIAEKNPGETKPVWDVAQARLDSYFNRNLWHISLIFWFSLLAMIAGFIIIMSGVSIALQDSKSITPAIITASAGVLTEFIGATFLLVYKSTMAQATEYCRMLERMNCVGMAVKILDTLPDKILDVDLKNKTRAGLVQTLASASVVQMQGISPRPPGSGRSRMKKQSSGEPAKPNENSKD